MRVRFRNILLAAAVSLTSIEALAEPATQGASLVPRDADAVQVLGFAAGEHFDQAEAFSRALKKAISLSTTHRLASGDYSLEVLTAALGCKEKPDPSCLKKIAAKISSQRFLWGTLELDGQRIKGELHLHAEGVSDTKANFSYKATQTDATERELLGVAAGALAQLVGTPRYRVVVRSEQQTGSVLVDGKAAGLLVHGEATLELAAGEHRFRLGSALTADGGASSGGTTSGADAAEDTDPGQLARVEVTESTIIKLDKPTRSRGVPGNVLSPPAAADKPFVDEPPGSDMVPNKRRRNWGYALLGTGGGLLVGGVAVAAGLHSLGQKKNFLAYRDGVPVGQDSCDAADHGIVVVGAMPPDRVRSLCSQASFLEVAEVILFVGGGVAAGTGLYLLLTDRSAPQTAERTTRQTALETRISPRVVVGRGRTDVSLSVSF